MTTLDPQEYARRRTVEAFVKSLKSPCEQHLELLRIIHTAGVDYSENSNGVFFNLVTLPQDVCDKIYTFIEFTKQSQESLKQHDVFCKSLLSSSQK